MKLCNESRHTITPSLLYSGGLLGEHSGTASLQQSPQTSQLGLLCKQQHLEWRQTHSNTHCTAIEPPSSQRKLLQQLHCLHQWGTVGTKVITPVLCVQVLPFLPLTWVARASRHLLGAVSSGCRSPETLPPPHSCGSSYNRRETKLLLSGS